MTRRRGSTVFQKNIKDYIVPIIWWVLILFLLFSVFSWWDSSDTNINSENQSWISVLLDSESSQATVIYPWDYKKDLEGDWTIYKWEKILVKQWSVSLKLDSIANFRINRLWELKYLENWNFSVTSWEAWIDSLSSFNLDLNFAKLKIDENSHLSVSQNEMWSTVYLISWFVEIENLVWKNTVLAPWEKITISRWDASKWDIDLTLLKENLDQFFLKSDWFILNKWSSYIVLEDTSEIEEQLSQTWSTVENLSSSQLITFSNLVDESNVSTPLINISWAFTSEDISSIILNSKKAIIDKTNKTFKIENVDVSNKENDLVFKVYDDSNDVISRFVYTVYYNLGSSWNTSTTNSSWFKVNNFDVDWTKFIFTSPTTSNTYTTTETFVTIRWEVKAEGIDSITVNDFKLSSFNWKTWRYHADVSYNNLAEWTNVYEVKYFSSGKLVYTNYYTIIKKSNTPSTQDIEVETWNTENIIDSVSQ